MLLYGADERIKLDVLCIGPHPDDAEIGAGGMLRKLTAHGRSCGIVDLTEGEMSSGGDVETRRRESAAAAKVLQLAVRESLQLPDCGLEDTFEYRCKVAEAIRRYRPEVVLGPYYGLHPGRGLGHNDHIKGGHLVAHGANYAHLGKLPIPGEPWHLRAVYYYFLPPDLMPSFVVDVTDYYEDWLGSILCHHTQFGGPQQNPQMRQFFESMAQRWGRWAGGRYAQAFFSPWPLAVGDVLTAALGCVPLDEERL